jgi:hypothetical protein
MTSLRIAVPEGFDKHIPASIVRLTYLYPSCEFTAQNNEVIVRMKNDGLSEEIKREVMHQIYRERIYSETLSIRRWLSGE